MRVIDSMVMPGGWHTEQELRSGQRQRIEGRTYRELVERTLLFRQQHLELVPPNSATRENVESDLLMWICSRFPSSCTGSRGELPRPIVQSNPDYVRPINRVEEWIATLSSRELEWIDSASATRRARICVNCHLNQSWQTNCGSCNQNIRSRGLLLRGSHKTGFESQLRACLAYGWLLEVAVWLKNGFGSAAPRRQPPGDCWERQQRESGRLSGKEANATDG
jgi:hypothetical protein